MAVYFGADHVVWAGQAGLVTDKTLLERYASLVVSATFKACMPSWKLTYTIYQGCWYLLTWQGPHHILK